MKWTIIALALLVGCAMFPPTSQAVEAEFVWLPPPTDQAGEPTDPASLSHYILEIVTNGDYENPITVQVPADTNSIETQLVYVAALSWRDNYRARVMSVDVRSQASAFGPYTEIYEPPLTPPGVPAAIVIRVTP